VVKIPCGGGEIADDFEDAFANPRRDAKKMQWKICFLTEKDYSRIERFVQRKKNCLEV
jgi:hypothetical protein